LLTIRKDINYKTKELYQIGNMEFKYSTYECMNCSACFRKSVELNSIGIFRNFKNNKIVQKYEKEFKNLIISNPRSLATIKYIDKLNEKSKTKQSKQETITEKNLANAQKVMERMGIE